MISGPRQHSRSVPNRINHKYFEDTSPIVIIEEKYGNSVTVQLIERV